MKFHFVRDEYNTQPRQWGETIFNSGLGYWCGNDTGHIMQLLKRVIEERSKDVKQHRTRKGKAGVVRT